MSHRCWLLSHQYPIVVSFSDGVWHTGGLLDFPSLRRRLGWEAKHIFFPEMAQLDVQGAARGGGRTSLTWNIALLGYVRNWGPSRGVKSIHSLEMTGFFKKLK